MKILLVDDHPVFLEGLALVFAHEFPQAQVMLASSASAAQSLLARHADIGWVLLDLSLPDANGTAALTRLRAAFPQPVYVVMSADERPETILAAIDQGAAGFLPKTSRRGELVSALHQMLEGQVYLPLSVLAPTPRPARELDLSPRQLDVLRLLIEGKPNKAISRELGLSESTIKTHLAAIFRKLDANSRTQAVVAAARLGLHLHALS